ncbi:MAG: alanine/ornithine racemase family PLP-dependent enzyme, partial [Candidatus Aminicenantes bacterium]|nr:alanine/ornithine racemase family PLP-dependent enzyme [Candidatus Aminicenantes bacterium]
MNYPKLEINLRKLEYNARVEVNRLAKSGITIMGVNKVFNGLFETAEAIVKAGIDVVAESRVFNLKKLQHLPCQKCLLRTPSPSEIEEVVRYADISLNSEAAVIQSLSKEAVKQKTIHQVLLMVDMGDIREGIWFENREYLEEAVKQTLGLPNLELYGLGTNFNCYGSVRPTVENGRMFVQIARELEAKFGIKFKYISGGNCTSYHLIEKGTWPEGVNHLRIGALHQFGIEYVEVKYLDGFFHSSMDVNRVVSNLYILKAEIIEVNRKPTVPLGELGLDTFMQSKTFVDRGERKRALLALGYQDVISKNIWPVDPKIEILGQTFDHTIVDIENSENDYRVGDLIAFEVDYTGLLAANTSEG